MCWLYLGNRAQDGSISWVSGTYLSMETALLCHLEAEFSSVLNEGVVFAASYLKALSIAQQMIPWTPVGICIWNRWQHKCRGTRTSDTHKAQDPQQKLSQHILQTRLFLNPGTHRRAECLPERDTLLPTGEGRLLPLCRSSMDRLQGFDLSTELSTVLSTLSKSKLKQKRNATQDLIQIHTNTWMCKTCSFQLHICIRLDFPYYFNQNNISQQIEHKSRYENSALFY